MSSSSGPGPVRAIATHLKETVAAAARDLRSAWTLKTSLYVAAVVAASFLPLFVNDSVLVADLASGLYVVLAAVGLNFVLGLADMPSLGHGAFVGIGAFTVALLRVRWGWATEPATLAGVGLAAVAGSIVGVGAIRLRGAALAAATWIFAWLVAFVLLAFPQAFGGSQGLAVPPAAIHINALRIAFVITPRIHFEIGLALVALSLLAFNAIARSQIGFALTAFRQGRSAAAAIGADSDRLQLGAFASSAAIAGLAGALSVQLAGIADPTAYGPLRSVTLFVAVLLGGAGTMWGPVLGAAALGVIPEAARALGGAAGVPSERFEPVIAGALLLVALVLGRGGLVRILEAGVRKLKPEPERSDPAPPEHAGRVSPATSFDDFPGEGRAGREDTDVLKVVGLSKSFGGVAALEEVSFTLVRGEVHALIGPNGSGKSTSLRVLAGALAPDGGDVVLEGTSLGGMSPRGRLEAGLARTLQRTEVFPEMSVLEHAFLGAGVRRRYGGAFRTLFATPRARAEAEVTKARCRGLLAEVGLAWAADRPARELSGGDQRMLMILMAYASAPRVLLLDEPSAGMSRAHVRRLQELIETLKGWGVTILLVEHDLRLVGAVADRVTVLGAGAVISEGTPPEVSRDPVVVETYLGRASL
jgi:ABC-type branched-subunit amino acid transport system ATPase component/ABC-type branched-subunit amino acid transport system permease subunit